MSVQVELSLPAIPLITRETAVALYSLLILYNFWYAIPVVVLARYSYHCKGTL